MRNSSDIFNLKNQQDGDSTGQGVFSANGQCPLRSNININRRRNLHMNSSSFEYGSADSHRVYEPPLQYGGDVEKRSNEEIHALNGDRSDEDLEFIPEETESRESSSKNTPRGDADSFNDPQTSKMKEPQPKRDFFASKNLGNSSKKSPEFKKLNDRLAKIKIDETVTSSAMLRNPLTGVGMEPEQTRTSKKYCKKDPKWSW